MIPQPDDRHSATVLEALRDAGFSRRVARAVVGIGGRLRDLTRDVGVEHAAMLDAESGATAGSVIAGDTRMTDIAPLLRAMQPGRGYLQVHSHPLSLPPSDQDMALYVDHEQIRAMVVVGVDGAWHIIWGRPQGEARDAEGVLRAYDRELRALGPVYRALVDAGVLTPEAANRAGRGDAVARLADQLGLRYTRIEAPEEVRDGG